jgi:hypothetical protein
MGKTDREHLGGKYENMTFKDYLREGRFKRHITEEQCIGYVLYEHIKEFENVVIYDIVDTEEKAIEWCSHEPDRHYEKVYLT